jgi:arginase family enzyme
VSGSIPPNGVVRFNLSCAQATALATRLVDSLEQNSQDAVEVLPPYDYSQEFAWIIAKGLGIPPTVAAEGLGI